MTNGAVSMSPLSSILKTDIDCGGPTTASVRNWLHKRFTKSVGGNGLASGEINKRSSKKQTPDKSCFRREASVQYAYRALLVIQSLGADVVITFCQVIIIITTAWPMQYHAVRI